MREPATTPAGWRIAPPALVWLGLWAALVATAMLTRPLLPVDETRYLAVAWEMWRDGNFLVPHLNGEPYSHKPPLLFWAINLGWAAFGVVEWWPRMVAPLFGLGTLFLTSRLILGLWPDSRAVSGVAPVILLGSVFWALFTTLTMFDMLLAFCTVLALSGLLAAWRGRFVGGFLVFGLGIGLGILAKGPAILVHTLPVALLAPMWAPFLDTARGTARGTAKAPPSWKRWYGGVAAGVLAGAAMGLTWAIPAAVTGGAEYREAIFWGQSAGRMVDSFAHGRPWWWYMAVLPPMTLPWIIWPPLWRAVGEAKWRTDGGSRRRNPLSQLPAQLSAQISAQISDSADPPAAGKPTPDTARSAAVRKNRRADGGLRFCLAWFLPVLIIFSLISGKQLHYLLPVFPALALMAARLIGGRHAEMHESQWDQYPPALLAIILGLVLALAPVAAGYFPLPAQALMVESGWGWLLVVAGVTTALPLPGPAIRLAMVTGLSAVMVVVVHLAARPLLDKAYDLTAVAAKLGQWEREGVALAHVGKYHGQFNFLGRLEKPIAAIGLKAGDEAKWLKANPKGRIISYYRSLPPGPAPVFTHPFRNRFIAVWATETAIANPGIIHRRGKR